MRTHTRKLAPENPAAPTTTAPSDNAGTVALFTPGTTPGTGVLTLTLNDNSTVTGKVTDATEFDCQAAQSSGGQVSGDMRARTNDGGGGDNQGGSDEQGSSGGSGDDNEPSDDNDDQNGSTCDSSSLVKGAIVHEAELRIDSTGATFTKVELVK